jgi:hypothetical protein
MAGTDVDLSDALREKLQRQVLLALSRFGRRVLKVRVRLAEPVNLLGGVDQLCRMRVRLQDGHDIDVEAINGGFEGAVARAATQLSSRIAIALADDGHLGGGRSPAARPPPALRPRRRTRPK